MRLELHAFEYLDERCGKWQRARWRAHREEIEKHYPKHRLVGEPEVREVTDDPKDRFPTSPSRA